MKKKIFIALVAILGIVLIPSNAKAASYKDYFDITYSFSKEGGRSIQLIFTDYKDQVESKDCVTDQITGSFLVENETGEYEEYATGKFAIGRGDDTFMQYYVTDEGLENDVREAGFKVVLVVNLKDYKAEITIDLNKAEFGEANELKEYKILNPEEAITEELTKPTEKTEVIPEDNKVSKDMFNEIKNAYSIVTYEAKKDDKVSYAWTFDGSKMTDVDYDLDLTLTVDAKDEIGMKALVPITEEKPMILEFKHHGILPTGTTVTVNVSDNYKDGDKVTLYYYNEETKKLEEVSKDLVVKDGMVSLALEHCSYYLLAKTNTAPNNAQTSSMNVYLYMGVAAISLVGIILSIKALKKNS